MKTLLTALALLVLGAAFALNTPTIVVAGTPIGPASGQDDQGEENTPTKVEGKVGTPTPIVCIEITNDTGEDNPWTDIHLQNVKYKEAGKWKDANFDDDYNSGDGILIATIDGGGDSAMGPLPASSDEIGGSTKVTGGGGGTLAHGESLKVCFWPRKGLSDLAADTEVQVEVIGTEGATSQHPKGAWISATAVNEIGDDSPRATVASLSIPGFTAGAATGSASAETLTLNDIALAETCGYRFDDGSLVVKPNRSTSFAIDADETTVLIYDEDGEVVGGSDAGVGNLRINEAGALVMDLLRNQDHDRHVVLVIRGLKLSNFEHLEAGDEVRASAYGAAVPAEGVLEDLWKVVEFTAS